MHNRTAVLRYHGRIILLYTGAGLRTRNDSDENIRINILEILIHANSGDSAVEGWSEIFL